MVLLLGSAINPVWADEGVDIKDLQQISALNQVQIRLDSVSTAVMSCMDAGKEHPVCLCQNQKLIIRFNTSVNELFINHPELKQLDIVRFKSTDGIWVSQSLKGIKRQAETNPSCD